MASIFSVMGRIQMELRLHRFIGRIQREIDRLLEPAAWRVRYLRYLCQSEEGNKMMPEIFEDHAAQEKQHPMFLFWLPEEPGGTEAMTMPELAYEIEKQEYNLLCLKAVEFGAEGTERPFNWHEALEQTTEILQQLRLSLERRMIEALGVQENGLTCDEDQPEEFRDHGITSWAKSSELEQPEDILACWHISDCFPFGLSFEKLQLVEKALKAQIEDQEAEETAYGEENALDLWRFRWDIKAEQLEQIQNMMRDYSLDYEE